MSMSAFSKGGPLTQFLEADFDREFGLGLIRTGIWDFGIESA